MTALQDMVLMVKAASDYQAGSSLRQISKKYGAPYSKVRRLVKQSGTQLRPQGRQMKWTSKNS